jgi:hypothetical protein
MQRTEELQTLLDNEAGRGREGGEREGNSTPLFQPKMLQGTLGRGGRYKPPAKTAIQMTSEGGSNESSNTFGKVSLANK